MVVFGFERGGGLGVWEGRGRVERVVVGLGGLGGLGKLANGGSMWNSSSWSSDGSQASNVILLSEVWWCSSSCDAEILLESWSGKPRKTPEVKRIFLDIAIGIIHAEECLRIALPFPALECKFILPSKEQEQD